MPQRELVRRPRDLEVFAQTIRTTFGNWTRGVCWVEPWRPIDSRPKRERWDYPCREGRTFAVIGAKAARDDPNYRALAIEDAPLMPPSAPQRISIVGYGARILSRTGWDTSPTSPAAAYSHPSTVTVSASIYEDSGMAQSFIACDREQELLLPRACASGFRRTIWRGL